MFSTGSFLKSLKFAFKGLKHIFQEEQNFRFQIVCGIIVLILVIFLPFELWERVVLLMLVGAILVLEIINTVVERLLDVYKPRLHHYVEMAKDMMAAAVLIASLIAVVIGVLIIVSLIFRLLNFGN
jgi:undecaprenol kinase